MYAVVFKCQAHPEQTTCTSKYTYITGVIWTKLGPLNDNMMHDQVSASRQSTCRLAFAGNKGNCESRKKSLVKERNKKKRLHQPSEAEPISQGSKLAKFSPKDPYFNSG
eukprot:scaffold261108_cov14-Tisochrysis_lutea.AAC.2